MEFHERRRLIETWAPRAVAVGAVLGCLFLLAISLAAGCRAVEPPDPTDPWASPESRRAFTDWLEAGERRQLEEVGATDWHEKTRTDHGGGKP